MKRISQAPPPNPERIRAEELTQEIADDLRVVGDTFWRIGERLHEIQQKRLYTTLGYETYTEYIQGRLDVALSQAKKMVRIVRNYVQGDAQALGLERAYALIGYAEAVGEDPGLLVRKKAKLGEATILEASKRDILEATKRVRAETSKRRGRSEAARRVAREHKAIREGIEQSLGREGLRAHTVVWNQRDDEFVVRMNADQMRRRYLPDHE